MWLALRWVYDLNYQRWLHSRGHRTWPDEPFLLGWMYQRLIWEATGLSDEHISDATAALVARGIVEQKGEPVDGYLWRMVRTDEEV